MDRVRAALPDGLSSRFVLLFGGVSAAGLMMAFGVGCQSYERRPLDLSGHRAAFVARTPESPEVRAFADALAAQSLEASMELGTGFDLSDGVSRAEAEVIALVFNADLRTARMRAGVTRATAANAGLWADPTLGVDVTRIVQSTPEPWKVFSSLGITIPISGRLEVEKRRAGVAHAAELARVAQREWSVRMAVRRAWSERWALDAQLESTHDFLHRVEQILAVVDKMEQAGEMARTEARLFRIERASKKAESAMLESRAQEADLLLRRLLGVSPDAPLRFQREGLWAARTGVGAMLDPADLEHRSPALAIARAEYEAAESALELEIRKQYPDLHIGPGYGREDGQDQILLGLSLPIPVVNANRQGIAEALAQREAARASAEAALEEAMSSSRAAEVRLAAAVRRRQALESEIVPLVDAQYADAREVARLGEVNALVLLESLTRQQAAKVGLIEAARDEAIAAIDLDEVIGPAVEAHSSIDSPVAPSLTAPTPNVGPDR